MQVSKTYSGTMESVGSTGVRQVSYGVTTTITTYPTKVDFVNQTIANFLHDECGVDAAYEARGSSTEKFLWIYGVPFLLATPTGTANYFNFYGPLYATPLITGNATTTNTLYSMLFSTASSGVYSFTIYFTGNPKTGFALRIKGYNATAIATGFIFRFIKAENVISGAAAVVWAYGNPTAGSNGLGNTNGIDLDADGSLNESSFSTDTITYQTVLGSKAANKTSNPNKFPLVPIMAGIWKLSGMYRYLVGYNLADPALTTQANQIEVQIAGRRFIITNNSTMGSNTINLGLMEVDD